MYSLPHKKVSIYVEPCQVLYVNNMIYGELFLFSWYHTASPGPHCISMTSAGERRAGD